MAAARKARKQTHVTIGTGGISSQVRARSNFAPIFARPSRAYLGACPSRQSTHLFSIPMTLLIISHLEEPSYLMHCLYLSSKRHNA